MKTLTEAQEYVANNIINGSECPCCNQMVKVRTQYFHKTLAWSLFWIHFASSKVHTEHNHILVSDTFSKLNLEGFNAYSKLEFWDLISRHPNKKGFWRINKAGVDFLKGEIKINSKVRTYNNKCIDYIGNHISIHDSIPNFDLNSRLQKATSRINLL